MSQDLQYSPHPPRVRVEWLVAGVRVALAAGALLAIAVDPSNHVLHAVVAYLFSVYLVYSLAVLGLVWAPVRFFRGWDLVVFAVDFAIFSLLIVVGEEVASPFFAYFVFLAICATLRWQARGTMLMVVVAVVVYPAIGLLMINYLGSPISVRTVAIRAVNMLVISTLLGYLGALQHRFQLEISRLASWPRRISRSPRDVVSEVMTQSAALLEAPRLVLIWEELSTGRINLAWRDHDDVSWTDEPEGSYGSLVLPALERRSFQTSNAGAVAEVVMLNRGGFRNRRCRPLNEALRARFDMRAVQSWPLEGDLLQGRLFALDKTRMGIDDLVIGELVANLAVSRLESLYILERLRDAAALDERVRVARDLHDSLLQSQTGAALQLLAARRLLDRDPDAGKERFEEMQQQLERGELEMRSFISRLRPERNAEAKPPDERLSRRLEDLRRRVGRQWNVKVVMNLDAADTLPGEMAENVYRLAHEGVVNAARHADASIIDIDLKVTAETLRLAITDDGTGFPFQGTYDLAELGAMNQGPVTLRERVAELRGALTLRSHDTGSELLITLPLAHAPQ